MTIQIPTQAVFAKVGALTLENEALRARVAALESQLKTPTPAKPEDQKQETK